MAVPINSGSPGQMFAWARPVRKGGNMGTVAGCALYKQDSCCLLRPLVAMWEIRPSDVTWSQIFQAKLKSKFLFKLY